MTLTVWTVILIVLGILFVPVFTLSMILFALGHPILGIIALIVSILRGLSSND